MIKNSRFIRNILWNLSGFIVPILVAILAIPIIIANIGIERFGILTLIFALIGFMNLFDFGLTRSITNSIVSYQEKKETNKVAEVINTGMVIMLTISFIISFLVFFFSSKIVANVFSVNPSIFDEVKTALSIISCSLPFVIMQSSSISILEAFERFKLISLAKTPFSILMYALPATVSYYSPSLVAISLSLVVLRIIMAVSFFFIQRSIVNKVISSFHKTSVGVTFNMSVELLKYGGWVSISNIIAPLMLYIDRFFVASIVGAGVVAYYTTPFEMISKMSIVAISVSGVLFPLLVKTIKEDKVLSQSLYLKALLGIGLSLSIPLLIGLTFSREIITLWIDSSFAEHSWLIFCLFLVGFFVHGLIQPAYIWIQAAGKPMLTAIAHIFDFILYVIYFPFFTEKYGLIGAVSSWVLRVSISFIVLHSIRYKLYKSDLR